MFARDSSHRLAQNDHNVNISQLRRIIGGYLISREQATARVFSRVLAGYVPLRWHSTHRAGFSTGCGLALLHRHKVFRPNTKLMPYHNPEPS